MHSHIRQRALYFGQSSLNRPETTNVTVRRERPYRIRHRSFLFFFPRCVSRFCLCFSRAWYSWKHKYHHLMCTWRRFQLCTFRRGTILTITRNSSLESMPQNSLLTILHKKSYTWQVRSICLFYQFFSKINLLVLVWFFSAVLYF